MKISKSVSYRYLAQESILFFIFSYLVFLGSSKFSLINPQILLIDTVLLTFIPVIFILKRPIAQSAILLPLAVMLAVMGLASLTSIDLRRSLAEWVLVSAAICLFFLVSELLARGWPGELVIKVVLWVGAIFMALCWSEFINWYSQWLMINPGVWLPGIPFRLSNPNLVAVLVNVWLMMALGGLAVSQTHIARFFLGLWVLSALIVLYLTSSRGGWLGSATGLLCLGFLFLRTKKELCSSVWNKIKNKRALLLLLGMALLALLTVIALLAYRQMNQPSHGSRDEFWAPAMQAFLSSPLLGKGPHTFISAYLQANHVPPYLFFDYAHSIYMDLLSGNGLLGLLAFVGLMFSLVRELWRQLKQSTGENWGLTAGALAALTAFCVHGFVDSVHHTEPISLWNLCILMGAVLLHKPQQTKSQAWSGYFKISLSVIVMCFSWFNYWAISPFQAGLDAANQGNWLEAEKQLNQAVIRDSTMTITHQQLGYVLSQETAAGDISKLQPAITAFERTVQLDPYWAVNQANLGALYRSIGNINPSRAAFTQAVKLAPDYPVYQLNLGDIAETGGDLVTATQAYQQALTLAPQWREAYFWRATPFRTKVQQNWAATQPVISHPKTQIQLEQDIALSPAMIQPYLDLTQVYLDNGQMDLAESTLNKGINFASGGGLEVDWLKAELLAERGDPSRAALLGEKVMQAQLNPTIFGPGISGNALYTIYMFRRASIPMDFVPQLETISLNDIWGKRVLQLANWFERSGSPEKSQYWRDIVFKKIPDLNLITRHNLSP